MLIYNDPEQEEPFGSSTYTSLTLGFYVPDGDEVIAGPNNDPVNPLAGALEIDPLRAGKENRETTNITIPFIVNIFLASGVSLTSLFNWITPMITTIIDMIYHMIHHSSGKNPSIICIISLLF